MRHSIGNLASSFRERLRRSDGFALQQNLLSFPPLSKFTDVRDRVPAISQFFATGYTPNDEDHISSVKLFKLPTSHNPGRAPTSLEWSVRKNRYVAQSTAQVRPCSPDTAHPSTLAGCRSSIGGKYAFAIRIFRELRKIRTSARIGSPPHQSTTKLPSALRWRMHLTKSQDICIRLRCELRITHLLLGGGQLPRTCLTSGLGICNKSQR